MVQGRPLAAGSKLNVLPQGYSSSLMLGCWLIPLKDCGVCTSLAPEMIPKAGSCLAGARGKGFRQRLERTDANRCEQLQYTLNHSQCVCIRTDCWRSSEKGEIHFPEGRRCSRESSLKRRCEVGPEAAQGQGMKTL